MAADSRFRIQWKEIIIIIIIIIIIKTSPPPPKARMNWLKIFTLNRKD
jgi:hypothetical protein